MAFTVYFYTFSKKENSTAQPSGGTSYNCQLKAPCGILNPRIRLDLGASGNPAGYNYAYIASFNRYYWVREWTNIGPVWEADLAVDVLASYKSAIGSANLYALRSAYSSDGDIIDALYPCKAGPTVVVETLSGQWRKTPTSGLYVVGIVATGATANDTAAQVGSIKYYFMDLAGLAALSWALLDNTLLESYGLDASYARIDLQKSIIDPLQYIKSCVWIPLSASDLTGSVTLTNQTIKVNGWNVTGIHSAPVSNLVEVNTGVTGTVQTHPQAATRGNYMNMAPYTRVSMSIPPYGNFEIDPALLNGQNTIYVQEAIDITNGKGILHVTCGGAVLAHLSAMRGVNIQLSQITTDYIGATSQAVGGAAGAVGAALMGDIAGAIGAAVGGIANAVKASAPIVSTISGGGSFMENFYDWQIITQQFTAVADDNSHHGRPLCQNITVSSYPGYLLIQDADIAIAATEDELSKIRAYLESGFYYE